MKFCLLFLGLASILGISSAQTNADALKNLAQKFDLAEQVFCGNKQISDDQLAEINNKCVLTDGDNSDALVKTCLKVNEITARQKMMAFCDKPAKECMVKEKTEKLAKAKAADILEGAKNFETYLTCVKTVLKVQ